VEGADLMIFPNLPNLPSPSLQRNCLLCNVVCTEIAQCGSLDIGNRNGRSRTCIRPGFILAEAVEIEVYSRIHTPHAHSDGITNSGIWYALRMLSAKGSEDWLFRKRVVVTSTQNIAIRRSIPPGMLMPFLLR
jgi:hypothetical protein